jgi:hypothetical protein
MHGWHGVRRGSGARGRGHLAEDAQAVGEGALLKEGELDRVGEGGTLASAPEHKDCGANHAPTDHLREGRLNALKTGVTKQRVQLGYVQALARREHKRAAEERGGALVLYEEWEGSRSHLSGSVSGDTHSYLVCGENRDTQRRVAEEDVGIKASDTRA